tara:strand:- start:75 stop:482 length:408 start_codon:yes stop_codon:yes gene_type:complete
MRSHQFFVTVVMAWSCGFCSIGLGQEGALPVTTDLHAHGLNQQQLDSLADIMQHAVDQQAIAGCSFLIAHRGEIVFREAFGFADIELERAFTTNELVPIVLSRSRFSPVWLWLLLIRESSHWTIRLKSICLSLGT